MLDWNCAKLWSFSQDWTFFKGAASFLFFVLCHFFVFKKGFGCARFYPSSSPLSRPLGSARRLGSLLYDSYLKSEHLVFFRSLSNPFRMLGKRRVTHSKTSSKKFVIGVARSNFSYVSSTIVWSKVVIVHLIQHPRRHFL